MKQYPIWNVIKSCIYKSDKSYGIREHGETTILVGSSSRNSHHFLTTETTHRLLENGDREFRFYVDGVYIKNSVLKKGSDHLETKENDYEFVETTTCGEFEKWRCLDSGNLYSVPVNYQRDFANKIFLEE